MKVTQTLLDELTKAILSIPLDLQWFPACESGKMSLHFKIHDCLKRYDVAKDSFSLFSGTRAPNLVVIDTRLRDMGITRTDLAELLGVTRQGLSSTLKSRNWHPSTFKKYSSVLEVSVFALILKE